MPRSEGRVPAVVKQWITLGLKRYYHGNSGSDLKPVHRYNVGPVDVYIVYSASTGRYYYFIDEPELPEELRDPLERLLSEAALGRLRLKDGAEHLAEQLASRHPELADVAEKQYPVLTYYLQRSLSGYGPLYPLLKDSMIEEVAVEAPGIPVAVYHRLYSDGWMDTNIVLVEEELDSLALSIARKAGKHLSVAVPFAEGLTEEGHRVALTFSREVSRRGSSIVIRKYPDKPLTIVDLLKSNTLSPLEAAYLWMLVEAKAFLLIVGGMASGKTSMLQALATLIPPDQRIVTLEDTPELNLPHTHWDPLVTRYTYFSETAANVDLLALAKFALRRRSDYIIIGEVRGEEARMLAQAAATGQGSMCLEYSDRVLVKQNGNAKLIQIGELVEHCLSIGYGCNMEILSFDPLRWKPVWARIRRYVKTYTTSWVEVKTLAGRQFRVTPDHPVPVITSGNPSVKPAYRLKPGDKILVIGRLPPTGTRRKQAGTTGSGYRLKVELASATKRREGSIGALLASRDPQLVEGFAESILDTAQKSGPDTYNFKDMEKAYLAHYALKLLGVDSAISGNGEHVTLKILRGARNDAPFLTDVITGVRIIRLNGKEPAYDVEVDTTHLFVHGSSIVTHNCTFHADGVESTLVRLSSPPISLGESFLSLIWAILVMRRVRIRGKGTVRRLIEVAEMVPTSGARTVFAWNPETDQHLPSTAEEVVGRSYRLKQVAKLYGWSTEELAAELGKRELFLTALSRGGSPSYLDVARAVARFYARR